MAWILKCIECAKKNGIDTPNTEIAYQTNFVR